MSQAGVLNFSVEPGVLDTLTGNTGGPVSPDASNNINVTASGGFSITGNPGTHTLNMAPSGWTLGSVVFASSATAFSQDNTNFFWDSTNHRLGIGNNGPTVSLDVTGSGRFTATVSSQQLNLNGATSGTISILPQSVAGTFNFNLPTSAGTSGYFLTSGGGGASPMTWTNPASSLVTSISATAPITASASTGAVTIGLTTPLALNFGGTNANLTASNGGIFYSTATAGAILAGTATANQVLLSGSSAAPSWSTATYPSTTTINQLLYSSSNNVIGGIAASANGVLISSATNVPSWLAAGTTGQVLSATTGSPASWATLSSIAVTSISGTANQISASASVGAVTLSFTNGISIGSYQATSPPTGGIICPGTVGIGTNSPTSNNQLQVTTALAHGIQINGTQTAVDGVSHMHALNVNGVYNPTAGATLVSSFEASATFQIPTGQTVTSGASFHASPTFTSNLGTITTMYGYWFDGGGSLPGGTITTSYGAYFAAPASGTTKVALYSDNASIGYTGTTPPTNGLIVNGQTGILCTSLNSTSSLLQVGNSTYATHSNYLAIDAANAVDKGIEWYSAGTARALMIVPGGSPTFLQINNTGTQVIGMDLTNLTTMIGTGTAVNKMDVNGSCAIGSYAGVNVAPTNGLIVSGNVAIATTSPPPCNLANTPNNLIIGGVGISSKGLIWESTTIGYASIIYNSGSGTSNHALGISTTNTSSSVYILNCQANTNARFVVRGDGSVGVSTGTPASTFDVVGSVSLGSYGGSSAAPTNGLIVSGQTGIGTSSVNASAQFQSVSTNAYNHLLTGTQTSRDGSTNQGTLYVNSTLNPTSGSGVSAGLYINEVIISPNAQTIGTGCGAYINTDTSSNVGTISNLSGLYIDTGSNTPAGTVSAAYGVYINQPFPGNTTSDYYAININGGVLYKFQGSATDYTVKRRDYIVAITDTTAARTVTLPSTPPLSGWVCIVKDASGGASTHNITVSGNGHNIDGSASLTINTNYGVLRIYSNGTQYYTW